ncbi:MAG: sulfatase-like hydrolase/transferase, partial [Verrucomicrobiota bacterium]
LFLYLALPSPHTPWLPTEEYLGKSGAGMYGDFVMQVDDVVGKVSDSLEAAGMTNDTLVLFSSDNGPVWYDKDTERFNHRTTGPLRGVKGSVWEGGHRMPFIVRWPAQVGNGTMNDRTVAFADVFATFAQLAGQKSLPEGMARDSVSFADSLFTDSSSLDPRPPVLHGERSIRAGDWKLIATKGGRGFGAPKKQYGIELYNLKDDLSEENNLADQMPEKVDAMRGLIQKTLAD